MDLDPEARRLLQLTREARTPSARDKARIQRCVGATLALAPAKVSAAPARAAGTLLPSATAWKWTGIALFALAGGGGYFAWRQAERAPAASPAPLVAASVTPVVRPVAVEPVADAPAAASGSALEPSPTRARSPAPVAVKGTLPEEFDLLHDAQASWRAGRGAEALGLLKAHLKRFPRSQLAPERDALTVLSLCSLKRAREAQRVARRFLQAAPDSLLKSLVEESCAVR